MMGVDGDRGKGSKLSQLGPAVLYARHCCIKLPTIIRTLPAAIEVITATAACGHIAYAQPRQWSELISSCIWLRMHNIFCILNVKYKIHLVLLLEVLAFSALTPLVSGRAPGL